MSASQQEKVAIAKENNERLEKNVEDVPPTKRGTTSGNRSKPPWPLPYWSKAVHGEPGQFIDEKCTTHDAEVNHIRNTLERLRWALSKLPWLDGRPVRAPEQRIRVEVAETEAFMSEHVRRMSWEALKKNQAPSDPAKRILKRAFMRYEQRRHNNEKLGLTGDVTVKEFTEVWNELGLKAPVLRQCKDKHFERVRIKRDVSDSEALSRWRNSEHYPLWDSERDEDLAELEPEKGEPFRELLAPKRVTEAHAAAIFLKYGYDRDGLMPYDVFCNALLTPPAHLSGMRETLDQRARGLNGFEDTSDSSFEGKILYPHSRTGVFSPSDFNSELTERSSKPPSATLKLEYAHGYEGQLNLSSNAFYTDNPAEVVYYVAGLGVVLNTQLNTQRFFFGHNNEITCLARHPCKWIVATGQNKAAGPSEVPYVCVWETRGCRRLQRIDHPFYTRAIIAAAFSPGGARLVTIASDNSHSVFVWDWLTSEKKLRWLAGRKVADLHGWPVPMDEFVYGPSKRLRELEKSDSVFFYSKPFPQDMLPTTEHNVATVPKGAKDGDEVGPAPSGERKPTAEVDAYLNVSPEDEEEKSKVQRKDTGEFEAWMEGEDHRLRPQEVQASYQGAPPKVYGALWHPKNDAFITWGYKHLMFWFFDEEENRYMTKRASHANKNVENIVSAAFIPDPQAGFRRAELDEEHCPKRFLIDAKVTKSGKVIQFLRDSEGNITGERLRVKNYDWASASDMLIAAGFASGEVGLFAWIQFNSPESKSDGNAPNNRKSIHVPRADEVNRAYGSDSQRLCLVRVVQAEPSPKRGRKGPDLSAKELRHLAHRPGPKHSSSDGSFGTDGVCSMQVKILEDSTVKLYSGGADGRVIAWNATQVGEEPPEGTLERVGDERTIGEEEVKGSKSRRPNSARIARLRRAKKGKQSEWQLRSPYRGERGVTVKSLDVRNDGGMLVGTNQCELMELGEKDEGEEKGNEGDEAAAESDEDEQEESEEKVRSKQRKRKEESGRAMPLNTGHAGTIWGIAAHPFEPNIFVSAAQSSTVKVWDAKGKHMLRASSVGFRCQSVAFSKDGSHIAVGSMRGRVKVLKSETMQPVSSFRPAESGISDLKYSPNNRVLAVASHDTCVDLYDTGFRMSDGTAAKYPGINSHWHKEDGGKEEYVFIARCDGHSGTVWHVDFSLPLAEPMSLVGRSVMETSDTVRELLHYDMRGRAVHDSLRNARWQTRTQTIGFDVMGIWEEYSSNFDINSLDRSPHTEHCVTGDNFSLVKLFNYPVTNHNAPFRAFFGHSSFVTSTRFSPDGRRLFTAGGRDRATLQFLTHGICKQDSFESRKRDAPYCDVAECLFCGRDFLPPPPPPLFGPHDEEGRVWGPIAFDSETAQCNCASCDLRLRREFGQYDPDGDGFAKESEIAAALRNFGERSLTKEDVAKAIRESGAQSEEGFVELEPFIRHWLERLRERRKRSEERRQRHRAKRKQSSAQVTQEGSKKEEEKKDEEKKEPAATAPADDEEVPEEATGPGEGAEEVDEEDEAGGEEEQTREAPPKGMGGGKAAAKAVEPLPQGEEGGEEVPEETAGPGEGAEEVDEEDEVGDQEKPAREAAPEGTGGGEAGDEGADPLPTEEEGAEEVPEVAAEGAEEVDEENEAGDQEESAREAAP